MIVKIRDIIINTEDEPALIVLSDEEKELISNMSSENNQFCSYPQGMPEVKVIDFMTKHPDNSKLIL